MFAGMPGRGAEDASYEAAVLAEHAASHDEACSGTVADILKCFDQLPRDLLYWMLLIGGIPQGILTAYRNFEENIRVYNSVAGGIGQPYKKRCSIPQGCPFSTMFISLMLRPLSQLMKIKHSCVYFRMLADDLLLMYIGDQITFLAAAFDDVHMFLHALG